MDMNNVVQNIEVSMIMSPSERLIIDDNLQNLVDSIREYGILEPLLLRPNNGKYQIIIGNKRYEAARLLGLKTVPALVKNVDDEVVEQYKMINNYDKKKNAPSMEGKFINSSLPKKNIPSNGHQPILGNQDNYNQPNDFEPIIENSYQQINNRTKNSDIINLSELNKIEYERDDFNMNNNVSNIMNNSTGVSPQPMTSNNQEPTFGGRFFPSLEDEPTNMNMGSVNSNPQNNNLIDLTDINTEQGQPSSNQQVASFNTSQPQNLSAGVNPTTMNNQFNISRQQEQLNPIPGPTDNVINVGALQSENQMTPPTMGNQPIMQESTPIMMNQPSTQEPNSTINNQIQNQEPASFSQINPAPIYNNMPENNILKEKPEPNIVPEPQINIPQFDMSQNIAPTGYANPTPEMNVPTEVSSIQPPVYPENNQPVTNIPVYNQEIEQPIIENKPLTESSQKDLTPVLNTIKSLIFNLESFGYQININEEDLSNAVKITIEVEK